MLSMSSLKMLNILLLMLQFRCCFVTCFEETKNSRSFNGAVFTQENARLLNHQFKRIKVVSAISCSQACLAHPRCISTNFKIVQQSQSMICELNDFCVSRWPRDQEEVQVQRGFIYTQYFVNNGLCPRDGTCSRKSCENREKRDHSSKTNDLPSCNYCKSIEDTVFNFTTLGAIGKEGPNHRRYSGRHMQNVTIHKGIQHWVVPISGQYKIILHGASGGDGAKGNIKGGNGATAQGTMYLSRGTELKILVGQRGLDGGSKNVGSGGGATFVAFASSESGLISVAGGGGGGGLAKGDPGQTVSSGSPAVAGGKNMSGGLVYLSVKIGASGAGGGYYGNGSCCMSSPCVGYFCSQGGKSFLNGGNGGTGLTFECDGGFGGGGACLGIPGGGGGYSGGGIEFGLVNSSLYGIAGGGGSYRPYQNWTIKQGQLAGDGFALFRLVE